MNDSEELPDLDELDELDEDVGSNDSYESEAPTRRARRKGAQSNFYMACGAMVLVILFFISNTSDQVIVVDGSGYDDPILIVERPRGDFGGDGDSDDSDSGSVESARGASDANEGDDFWNTTPPPVDQPEPGGWGIRPAQDPQNPPAAPPPLREPASLDRSELDPSARVEPLPSLVARVKASIVFLYFQIPQGGPRFSQHSGTGFVYAPGLIATNRHVVEEAHQRLRGEVSVRLVDGRTFGGRILSLAPGEDLAIVECRLPPDIQSLALGDSEDLRLAEDIVVIGYPLSMFGEVTVTPGVIGSFRRSDNRIQLAAAINKGNSGGPVFYRKTGEIIAIVVSKVENGEQIGFSIPVNTFKTFAHL